MILPQGSWWDLIPRAEFPDDLCVYLAIIVAMKEKSMARLEEPIFLIFRQHPYPGQLARFLPEWIKIPRLPDRCKV